MAHVQSGSVTRRVRRTYAVRETNDAGAVRELQRDQQRTRSTAIGVPLCCVTTTDLCVAMRFDDDEQRKLLHSTMPRNGKSVMTHDGAPRLQWQN